MKKSNPTRKAPVTSIELKTHEKPSVSVYEEALHESKIAFRKKAIFTTFEQIGIKALLSVPSTAEEVALNLGLNKDATTRFLYSAASLGLVILNTQSNKFHINQDAKIFSDKSSLTLFKLISSKIPDILANSPKTIDEVINACSPNQPVLQILQDCVELYLLKKAGHLYYLPNQTKPFLVSTSENYIGPMIEYLEKIAMPTFNVDCLIEALKSGQSQWQKYLNNSETVSNPFELYKAHPDLLEKFTFGLHKLNEEDNQILAQNLFNIFNDVQTILDIGGGSGCLALAITKEFPNISKYDIYELPDALKIIKSVYNRCSSNQTNINFVEGSFRETTDFGGLQGLSINDMYNAITMSWILHDWTDEVNLEILKKAYVHLKPCGKLVIIESVLPDNRMGNSTLSDITMLLHTEGRERTFKEYKTLLEQSGFKKIQIMHTKTRRQAIIGYK